MVCARCRGAAPEAQGGSRRSQPKDRPEGFRKPYEHSCLAIAAAFDRRDGCGTQSGELSRGAPAQLLPPAQEHQARAQVVAWRKSAGADLHPAGVGQPNEVAEHTAAGLDLPDGDDSASCPGSKGGLGQSERPPRVSEVLTEQRITAFLVRFLTRNGSKRMRFWCGGVGWDGGVRQV